MNIKYMLYIMENKECKEIYSGCGETLLISEFGYKMIGKKIYYDTLCKKCRSIYNKEYYYRNRESILSKKKPYTEIKDRSNKVRKIYAEKNKEKLKEKRKIRNLKPEIRKRARDRQQERMKTDPLFRIKKLESERIRIALKYRGIKKSYRSLKYLNCTIDFLKEYLESKFRDGMNWNNGGNIWHIDHILPMTYFNLLDIEEQMKAFHYSNLQPLFKEENLSKSDKIFPQILYRVWNGDMWVDFREIKLLPKPQ